MEEPKDTPTGGLGRAIDLALTSIGTFWLTLTGLCTAANLAVGLATLKADRLSELVAYVLAGGAFFSIIGGAIYALGRWLRPK